jgi:hypothetical protein
VATAYMHHGAAYEVCFHTGDRPGVRTGDRTSMFNVKTTATNGFNFDALCMENIMPHQAYAMSCNLLLE